MKIVIAMDSFKGSLSSLEAGDAVRDGILKVYPEARVLVCPLADGGEGTVDVQNPLFGESGASAVYGPQKGATPEMVADMDRWMTEYARLSAEIFPEADPLYPGAGAAGGIGFAFRTFLHAKLESGIGIVLDEIGLEKQVKDADYVITGEGRLDRQTAYGKAPVGVAKIAKQFDKPVLAFAGSVTPEATECNAHGIDAFFPILRSVQTLEQAMEPEQARNNLRDTAEQVFRLIKACKKQEF
jgi:glycerate 2-kinase